MLEWFGVVLAVLGLALAVVLALGHRRLRSWSLAAAEVRKLLAEGRAEEADARAGALLEEARGLLPAGDPHLLPLVDARARARQAVGALHEAEGLYKQALELQQGTPERREPTGARLLQLLSTCLRDQGRLIEAEGVAVQALEAGERVLAAGDPRLGDLHHTVAGCRQATGKLDQAELHYRRAAELLEAAGPEAAERLAKVRAALARLADARVLAGADGPRVEGPEEPVSLN